MNRHPLYTDLSGYFMAYCLRDEVNQLKYNDPGIIPSGQTYSFFVLLGINNESDSADHQTAADRNKLATSASGHRQINPQYDRIFKMHLCILDFFWI